MSMRLSAGSRAKRLEFLRRRQGGIGGSDLPLILGLSNYGSALDVYYSKTREIREEDIEDDTIHQLRGHAFEAMALAHYWLKTGRRGRKYSGDYASHPDYPNVIVTPDADIFADDDREEGMRGPGVGEVKAPVSSVYRRVRESGLRDSEIVQLQTNIAVTRRTWGSLIYFNMEDGQGPITYVDQLADVKMGEFLLRTGQRFWNEHVVPRVPPNPNDWALLMKEEGPPIVEVGGETLNIEGDEILERKVETMLAMHATAKEAEEGRKRLYADVLQVMLGKKAKKARIPGLAKLTVVTKKGSERFDAGTLANAMPLDRDAVARWLMENTDLADADVGALLMGGELDLDLSLFVRKGSPSQYLLARRSADEG